MEKNLTEKSTRPHTKSMPEDIESIDTALSQSGQSSGEDLSKVMKAMDSQLENILKEVDKAVEENAKKDKNDKKVEKSADTVVKEEVVKETKEKTHKEVLKETVSTLSKKQQRLIDRTYDSLSSEQQSSFLTQLQETLKSDDAHLVEAFLDEVELAKTDYKVHSLSEVVGPESLKRYIATGGGFYKKHQEFSDRAIATLQASGVSDEKIHAVKQKIEQDYLLATDVVKNKAEEKKDFKDVRSSLRQLENTLDRYELILQFAHLQQHTPDYTEHVEAVARPLEEESVEEQAAEINEQDAVISEIAAQLAHTEGSKDSLVKEEPSETVKNDSQSTEVEEIKPEEPDTAEIESQKDEEKPEDITDDKVEIASQEKEIDRDTLESVDGDDNLIKTVVSEIPVSPDDPNFTKGKKGVLAKEVRANAALDNEARLAKAEEILGTDDGLMILTDEQKEAILKAHYVGRDEKSGIYTYSVGELLEKAKILKEAGFSNAKIRLLMEYGITGRMSGGIDTSEEVRRVMGQIQEESRGFTDLSGKNDLSPEESVQWTTEQKMLQKGRDVEMDVADYFDGTYPDKYSFVGVTDNIEPQYLNPKGFVREISRGVERISNVLGNIDIMERAPYIENYHDIKVGQRDLTQLSKIILNLRAATQQFTEQQYYSGDSEETRQALRSSQAQLNAAERQFMQLADHIARRIDDVQDQMIINNLEPDARLLEEFPVRAHASSGEDRLLIEHPVRSERRDGGGLPEKYDETGLIGRGESSVEEDPMGRSVRSIEDLGDFMEKVSTEFQGKILTQLYKLKEDGGGRKKGDIVTEDQIPGLPRNSHEREQMLQTLRVYAFKKTQGEYARDVDNEDVPEPFRSNGNKVLLLRADEITEYFPESPGKPGDPPDPRIRRTQSNGHYWEAVRVVQPDQFMNWIRDYWMLIHSDDPDNPLNFFNDIMVNHPDQRGAVPAGRMHKDAGNFLRSRFLTDHQTGELRVFTRLREQIINEVWVGGNERNKEVVYKKIMHADEELPKILRDQVFADNLMAKTAAGGKNTLAMFFSLPEAFGDDFDPITGETYKSGEKKIDPRLGQASLLAYEIYYNIGDIKGLKRLLGEKASLFNRDAITRATLEVANIAIPLNLNDFVKDPITGEVKDGYTYYDAARDFLKTESDSVTLIDERFYHTEKGHALEGQLKMKGDDLKKWLDYMNPYFPVQKDTETLQVVRKIVENQMQEIIGIRKGKAGSGLAELHAYMRTYHDGVAARHDTGMGNRNSQTKYEFTEEYQLKQDPRDRGGNLFNRGVVKRTMVGVLHGMLTRNGEAVQDILETAINTQLSATEYYRQRINSILRGEIKIDGVNIEELRRKIDNGEEFEGDDETNKLIQQIKKLTGEINKKIHDQISTDLVGKQNQKYHLVSEALEQRLRVIDPQLKAHWETYKNGEQDTYKRYEDALGRLQFDEAQYTQYGGMHVSNGTGLFHEEMNSNDLPTDELTGRDFEGRLYFKPEKFGGWLEGLEKRMRYMIDTWKLPLGAMEPRLVNPKRGIPEYIHMPIIESIFGSVDNTGAQNGGVMKMAQEMIYRQQKEHIKELEKEIRKEKDAEKRANLEEKLNKLKNLNVKFTDRYGNVREKKYELDEKGNIKKDERGNPKFKIIYDSKEALDRRDTLQKVMGYIDYEVDEHGRKVRVKGKEKEIIHDPAGLFVKAYVKTRIANFLLSHTAARSPYARWTVEQRENFIEALALTNYFDHHDIEDIRKFSDNEYKKNLKRDLKKQGGKALLSGFWDFVKEFAGKVVSS